MLTEPKSIAQMTFSGLYGGREAVAFSLTKLMCDCLQHSVLYLIIEKRADQKLIHDLVAKLDGAGIKFRLFNIESRFSWRLVRELADSMRRDQIQVVHCHCCKSVIFSALARRLNGLRIKIAFTLHGLPEAISLKSLFMQSINLLSIMATDSIIGCCADRVRLLKQLPFVAGKTLVIQNGLDLPPRTASEPAETQTCQNFSGNLPPVPTVRIGLVGRLSSEKNIPLFLNAIAKINRDGLVKEQMHCIVAGTGALAEELRKMAVRLNIASIVEFPGFVADTGKLYQSLDILVLTSDYEGTPMCILEGMSFGLPILASSVGGVADVLEHARNGLLFKKGEVDEFMMHLIDLIRDPLKRQQLGTAAYETVCSQFSAITWRNRHIEHYQSLLGAQCHEE